MTPRLLTPELERELVDASRRLVAAGADDADPPTRVARAATLWRSAVLELARADLELGRRGRPPNRRAA